MRFYEIRTVPHMKPLTPAQARIRSLKLGVERSRNALKAERERQRQQREREGQQRERQAKQAAQRVRSVR